MLKKVCSILLAGLFCCFLFCSCDRTEGTDNVPQWSSSQPDDSSSNENEDSSGSGTTSGEPDDSSSNENEDSSGNELASGEPNDGGIWTDRYK